MAHFAGVHGLLVRVTTPRGKVTLLCPQEPLDSICPFAYMFLRAMTLITLARRFHRYKDLSGRTRVVEQSFEVALNG